jgi:hypothetical protein
MSETSWPLEGTVLNEMANEFAAEHGVAAPKVKPRKPATVYFRNKFSFKGWFWGYWTPFMISHRAIRREASSNRFYWRIVRQPWYDKQFKVVRGCIILGLTLLGVLWVLTQLFRAIFFSNPKGKIAKSVETFNEKWPGLIQ